MTSPPSKSEVQRLGRRGSYRLGQLAPQGLSRPAAPKPFRVTFARPSHRGSALAWVLAGLFGTALIWAGAVFGLWFVPFLVGLATGVAMRWGGWRLRVSLPAVVVMAVAGWGLALAVPAVRGQPIVATARTIAALAGLPARGSVGLAVTLAVAVLQAAVGLWLGRAIAPRRADDQL